MKLENIKLNDSNLNQKIKISPIIPSAAIGAAVATSCLYAPDLFLKTGNKTNITLEKLTNDKFKYPFGIEIEFFIPKNTDKAQFLDNLLHKAYKNQEYILEPVLSDPKTFNNSNNKKIKDIIEKLKSGIKLNKEELEFYSLSKYKIGKSVNNGEGFKVFIKKHKNYEEIGKFILDRTYHPWQRALEFVTPKIETKSQETDFINLVKAIKTFEPKLSIPHRIVNSFKNIITQLSYAISFEDKGNINGYELGKRMLPGFQGDMLTSTGYGSVHLHHDASHMLKNNPLAYINELNQYYNWGDLLETHIHPGITRQIFAKPHEKAFLDELNQKIAPQVLELQKNNNLTPEKLNLVWDKIASTFLNHYKTHSEIKYRSLNIVNPLSTAFARMSEDKLPIPLKGILKEKIGSKTTMEWRINTSSIDPKRLLTLNRIFQNMAKVAEDTANENKIIEINPIKYKDWRKNSLIKNFVQKFSLPNSELDFKSIKKLKAPMFDRAFFDNLLSLNFRYLMKVRNYENLDMPSLYTTIKSLKFNINKTIKSFMSKEVLCSSIVGLSASALYLITLNNSKQTKV